jgi:5'-nucleotidase
MKPLILITNDDGIHSPGLRALAECAADLGELLIVAPNEQQTSMSRSKFRHPSSGVIEEIALTINGSPLIAYGVHGTPALAVAHAVLEIAPRKPDICLSGINYGENISYSLSAGGTIGACVEAQAFRIPSLAVSQETLIELNHTREYEEQDWRATQHFARLFTSRILIDGLPDGVGFFNLNVPSNATPQTEWRWTRQSDVNYYRWSSNGKRDWSKPHRLRVEKIVDHEVVERDSDVWALAVDRVVSVTPMARNGTAKLPASEGSSEWRR